MHLSILGGELKAQHRLFSSFYDNKHDIVLVLRKRTSDELTKFSLTGMLVTTPETLTIIFCKIDGQLLSGTTAHDFAEAVNTR